VVEGQLLVSHCALGQSGGLGVERLLLLGMHDCWAC
jgi:hypothetical protein